MKSVLRKIFNSGSSHNALVLMYHRVSEPESDIWDIAVSPAHFAQHLQVLQKAGGVIPLSELTERVIQKKIRKNSIAITFDDGYEDNYLIARPLLEKYKLPATFFITSANIDQETPFWWDELEQLILFTKHLPPCFKMTIGEEDIDAVLNEEVQLTKELHNTNSAWKACDEAPPSLRCALFLRLWQSLKPLPHTEQQVQLQKVRSWANSENVSQAAYKTMTSGQIRGLSNNKLFEIGAHTVSHPALAYHSLSYQKQEMLGSRHDLKTIVGKDVHLLAYPYGNYNSDTLIAAADAQFYAAFTTEEKRITAKSNRYSLARYQVRNWSGPEFSGYLQQWLSKAK